MHRAAHGALCRTRSDGRGRSGLLRKTSLWSSNRPCTVTTGAPTEHRPCMTAVRHSRRYLDTPVHHTMTSATCRVNASAPRHVDGLPIALFIELGLHYEPLPHRFLSPDRCEDSLPQGHPRFRRMPITDPWYNGRVLAKARERMTRCTHFAKPSSITPACPRPKCCPNMIVGLSFLAKSASRNARACCVLSSNRWNNAPV